MNIGDFIDIDRQLHLDSKGRNEKQRLERDRRIGRTLRELQKGGDDRALLLAWKNNLERETGPSLGRVVEDAFRWTAYLLVFLGCILRSEERRVGTEWWCGA